jgi:hypothetical protein
MNSAYNIFRQVAGDKLLWVESVENLEQARAHAASEQSLSPGIYLIYDVRARVVLKLAAGSKN